jgi:putative ABC transport system ATP-binding protein
MAPLIETRDLIRRYELGGEPLLALAGVSVEVERGEFVAVMGPSGSGKSTFMNVVGCLDRPTSGSYRLAGEDVGRLSKDELAALRSKRIGFVFQQFNLLDRVDAQGNVEMPMIYAGADRAARAAAAQARLERVGLADRRRHLPSQLSGGQQQRVAIARALVNSPDLLLADEPTGALDSRTSLQVMRLFQELHAEGVTVMIVTHEPDVADFAERVIRFRDGRVISDDRQAAKRAADALAEWDARSPREPGLDDAQAAP